MGAIGAWLPLIPFFTQFGSPSFRRKVADSLPWPGLHRFLRVVDVMDDTTMRIYEHKKQVLHDDSPGRLEGLIGEGKDIITQFCAYSTSLRVNNDQSLPI